MKLPRSSRLIAAFLALVSMLFVQLAMASYACPHMPAGGNGAPAAMSAGIAHSGMVGCDGMDAAQPALCHAHAHGDTAKQALDKPELPPVQAFVPAGLVLTLSLTGIASEPSDTPSKPLLLTRATAPPIAIRHCCFRI